jgi:hypothetical protein
MRRSRIAAAAALIGVAVLLTACHSGANDNPAIAGGGRGAIGQMQDVTMTAVNGGQSGTAELLESPTLSLSITITLKGAPASIQEPAGIYSGTCSGANPATRIGLSPVIAGKSTSNNVNTTIDELSSTPHLIAVERSGLDATLISCGNIPLLSTAAAP